MPRRRVDAGQPDFPQLRIAEDGDGSFAARVDHDRRDRRHQSRHVHEVIRLDAFLGELVENKPAGALASIAHWSAQRGAATEPHDPDRRVERVAATDFGEMAGVFLRAVRGHALHAEGQVTHGHADAENPRERLS
jgi:hypothetical protein